MILEWFPLLGVRLQIYESLVSLTVSGEVAFQEEFEGRPEGVQWRDPRSSGRGASGIVLR